MNRKTISSAITFSGKGLHSGKSVDMTLQPSESGKGIRFQRIDVEGQPTIQAEISYVTTTARGTTIERNGVSVSTIEHILSAIGGLGIADVLIEINGPEVPIMDGSATEFVTAIKAVGLTELDGEIEPLVVQEPIVYKDEENNIEIIALPYDGFEVNCMIDFQSEVLGAQSARMQKMEDFDEEISKSRTFVFLHELEQLFDAGLIQGGDVDNAVILSNVIPSQEKIDSLAKKLGKDNLRIDSKGLVSLSKLRYPNEPARHKLLDIVGDLTLLGRPIKAKIFANRPGHAANVAFTKVLKKKFLEYRKYKGRPDYDPNAVPLKDINQIAEMLPHRHPFLMIDKIIELTPTYVVGVKAVTFVEPCFQGHFPGNPVFPGVLQMEALAQTGGILALSLADPDGQYDTYFLKMDNVKFKHMVRPGDVMLLKMEILTPLKRGIIHMMGTVFVGNKVVSEGELTAQIVKRV